MTYVLVHLRSDEPSRDAGRLTDYLVEQRSPLRHIRDSFPHFAHVSTGMAGKPIPAAVCVGHGGSKGLGPTPDEIWADAPQLGRMFGKARLYAYACSTTGELDSLGARAVEEGVAVFVGHDRIIESPLHPDERRMVAEVAAAAILVFLAGEDDERRLRQVIFDVGDEFLGDDIDLDATEHSHWWSQAMVFDRLACSLRVHRRD